MRKAAKANAQKLLDSDEAGVTDQAERIAGVAAGENKIVIESGILPTEAEVKEKYAMESMCVLRKRYWMKVVTSVMVAKLSEKARSMRKKSSL